MVHVEEDIDIELRFYIPLDTK